MPETAVTQMRTVNLSMRILLAVVFLSLGAVCRGEEMSYEDCKAKFEEIKLNVKTGTWSNIESIDKLGRLENKVNSIEDQTAETTKLYKNILTLKGNLEATEGMYDELVETTLSYDRKISHDDETIKRFQSYIKDANPSFAQRITGSWVSSHVDMAGAPMFAIQICLDEENDRYLAAIDPNCNYFHSKALENGNGSKYLYLTEGVEYTPSKKRMKITFKDGKLNKGNSEFAKALSDNFEKTSSETTSGIAVANRDNPLSGKNLAAQTLSESIGRIGIGIARELAVTKVKSYIISMEMYEIMPGVMKVKMDYNTFIDRSDGDSYIDDFIRREFFLYKLTRPDYSYFISGMGAIGAMDPNVSLFDESVWSTWISINMEKLGNFVKYRWKIYGKPTHFDFIEYNSNEDWVGVKELIGDIEDNPDLAYWYTVTLPFPKDKGAEYAGRFRYKQDVDFFDSPMFLIRILEAFDDEEEEIAGIRYKYQQTYDKARKDYLKKFKAAVEPSYGHLSYYDKDTPYNYTGGFKDYKFNGEGVLRTGIYTGKGEIVKQGTFRNDKLEK